jgi:hypothetical protein
MTAAAVLTMRCVWQHLFINNTVTLLEPTSHFKMAKHATHNMQTQGVIHQLSSSYLQQQTPALKLHR